MNTDSAHWQEDLRKRIESGIEIGIKQAADNMAADIHEGKVQDVPRWRDNLINSLVVSVNSDKEVELVFTAPYASELQYGSVAIAGGKHIIPLFKSKEQGGGLTRLGEWAQDKLQGWNPSKTRALEVNEPQDYVSPTVERTTIQTKDIVVNAIIHEINRP